MNLLNESAKRDWAIEEHSLLLHTFAKRDGRRRIEAVSKLVDALLDVYFILREISATRTQTPSSMTFSYGAALEKPWFIFALVALASMDAYFLPMSQTLQCLSIDVVHLLARALETALLAERRSLV